MTYRLYLCPVDEPLVDPNPDCPKHELHTPQPRGYINWFDWAASMNYKGHKQSRCPGCNLYNIWSGGRRWPTTALTSLNSCQVHPPSVDFVTGTRGRLASSAKSAG